MAHPTRTGDLVAFSYPPYQFDAATPGTLIAPSAFFGQHGYVPDVQDLDNDINMRATFIAGGKGVAKGTIKASDDRPGADAGVHARHPDAQHSQGKVLLKAVDGGDDVQAASTSSGSTTSTVSSTRPPPPSTGARCPSAARRSSARCSTRRPPRLPGQELILAGGDNVGASPPNSGAAGGHAGDRRRERLGSRRDLLRQPRVRLRPGAAAGPPGPGGLPVPGDQHRRRGDR